MTRIMQMDANGKNHFIGCSAWHPGDEKHDHIFWCIDLEVSEDLVIDLFRTGYSPLEDAKLYEAPCCYSGPSHVGLRQAQCRMYAYYHFWDDF